MPIGELSFKSYLPREESLPERTSFEPCLGLVGLVCSVLTKVSNCGFTVEPNATCTEGSASASNRIHITGIGDGVPSYQTKTT